MLIEIGNWRRISRAIFFFGIALVFAGCGGSGGTITPNQGVTINELPSSQIVPIGQTATLTVDAIGTLPLSYQWSENGAAIPGATGSSYTTPVVEWGPGDSTSIGTFQVTVSNSVGSVTSNTDTLIVGPRSPKAGDLRYLLWQQVDTPGLLAGSNSGAGIVQVDLAGATSNWIDNGIGSPLSLGSSYDCGGTCAWPYIYQLLPSPITGLNMYYWVGEYSSFASDLESHVASNVVLTSLDLEPAANAYAVSGVQTAQAGGFDCRIDPAIPPGSDQQNEIQAQAALDGAESRVVTAVSFDASGNAILISYGWTGDTTTVYETQTIVVPPGNDVGTAVASAGTPWLAKGTSSPPSAATIPMATSLSGCLFKATACHVRLRISTKLIAGHRRYLTIPLSCIFVSMGPLGSLRSLSSNKCLRLKHLFKICLAIGSKARKLCPLYAFDAGFKAYLKAGLGSRNLPGARHIGFKNIRGETIVKTVLLAFAIFFATSALAQNLPPACGPENVSFNVRFNKSQSSPPEQAPGRATVYFIQDNGGRSYGIGVHVIARIGVDGAWVGAIKDNSYFPVFLQSGEHHICVNLDSDILRNPVELMHFTAEAGKVYYFRSQYVSDGYLLLGPADSDEAKYQIAMFPLSVSKPKK